MRKIVFLDVDGVLNDLNILSTREELGIEHLLIFKSIVKSTNCEIVLSSSWRIMEEWKSTLRLSFLEHNIPLWKSETPRIKSEDFSIVPRRCEILCWLNDNVKEQAKVVVIDDEADANIKGHDLKEVFDIFIHTSMNTGLTVKDANTIIDFLK